MKCEYCQRKATRNHSNHKTGKLENLCEKHYSEQEPRLAINSKYKFLSKFHRRPSLDNETFSAFTQIKRAIENAKDLRDYELELSECYSSLDKKQLLKNGYTIRKASNAQVAYWLGERTKKRYSFKLPNFFDHTYILNHKKEKIQFLVTQPYNFDEHDLMEAQAFCAAHVLQFFQSHIFPSIHNPNRTISLVFKKFESKRIFHPEWIPNPTEESKGLWTKDKVQAQEKLVKYIKSLEGQKSMYEHTYSGSKIIKEKELKRLNAELDLITPLLHSSKIVSADISKTLYQVIDESAQEENVKITNYMREKLAQAIIGIVKDCFADFKENKTFKELQPERIAEVISESLKRMREWHRWSENEIKHLIYLWKIEQFDPRKISYLMNRSVGAVENMIDFIESETYLKASKFFKEIEVSNRRQSAQQKRFEGVNK